MRISRLIAAGLLLTTAAVLAHHGSPEAILPVTKGVYRLPFPDGTDIKISGDHVTHSPHNRLDMSPTASGAHDIVAAADGVIEYIQDGFDTTCPSISDDNPTPCVDYGGPSGTCKPRSALDCNGDPAANVCRNNYVWIRHPNGEWSKYTHMRFNSVPNSLQVGDSVAAGTVIGVEGDVGCASGTHLHFEVGRPDVVDNSIAAGDPNYDPLGIDPADCDVCGFPGISADNGVVVNANRQNRIPHFCGAGFVADGETVEAVACDGVCAFDNFVLGGTIDDDQIFYRQVTGGVGNDDNAFVIESGGGASIRGQSIVRLSPGFHAESGASLIASIGACDSPAH